MVALASADKVGPAAPALKRFVNVYRLTEVRAPERLDFADETRPDADYKVVRLQGRAFLLARFTSQPDDAMTLFDRIRGALDGAEIGVTVPHGWPRTMGPYKRWIDDVTRFGFGWGKDAGQAVPVPRCRRTD